MSRTKPFSEETILQSYESLDFDDLVECAKEFSGSLFEISGIVPIEESTRYSNIGRESIANQASAINIQSERQSESGSKTSPRLVEESEATKNNRVSPTQNGRVSTVDLEGDTQSVDINEFLIFKRKSADRDEHASDQHNRQSGDNSDVNRKRARTDNYRRNGSYSQSSERVVNYSKQAATLINASNRLSPTTRSTRAITMDGTVGGGGLPGTSMRSLSNCISTQDLFQRIKTENCRDRLVHDVVDTRSDSRHAFVIQKLRDVKIFGGIILAVIHNLENFRHIHIVHTCNYANGCRCTFLKNIQVKPRKAINARIICDLKDDYITNLLNYFNGELYAYIKIFVGGENWTLSCENSGKKFMTNIKH